MTRDYAVRGISTLDSDLLTVAWSCPCGARNATTFTSGLAPTIACRSCGQSSPPLGKEARS